MVESRRLARKSPKTEHGLGTLLRMPYQAMMADAVEPALSAAGFDDIRAAHLPVIQALAMNPEGFGPRNWRFTHGLPSSRWGTSSTTSAKAVMWNGRPTRAICGRRSFA